MRSFNPAAPASSSGVSFAAPASAVNPAPGSPLPQSLRQEFEANLGGSFSDVRVHQGPHVTGIGAIAYTRGTDIHFAPGAYQPTSESGRELIAHELTHVIQQGASSGPPIQLDTTVQTTAADEAPKE